MSTDDTKNNDTPAKPADGLTTVTAYLAVPYCLQTGTVIQVEGVTSRSGKVLECQVPWDGQARKHTLFEHDWFTQRADAVARLCELRDARVRKLETEAARLQGLTFTD